MASEMDFDRWAFLGSVLLCIPTCAGLHCPTCTYVTHTGDISDIAKTAVNTLLNAVQAPECAQSLPAAIPEIPEQTCAVTSGKESRCSYYAGTITMNINLYITDIEIPLKIYQRGCMQFSRANVPSNGCHSRNDVTEDKTFLKQLLDRASSALASSDIVNFVGNLCLCSDTYCQTSGANDVNSSTSYAGDRTTTRRWQEPATISGATDVNSSASYVILLSVQCVALLYAF